MMNLVDQLKASGKKLLEAEGETLGDWSKLKHNKQDLELFLQFHIVELHFKPKDSSDYQSVVCTSNTRLIEVFKRLKAKDKKAALKSAPFSGIKTRDSTSVLTFNLVDNKYNTISLRAWKLGSFVTITPKNVELLDILLTDLLKRPVSLAKKEDDLIFR